MQSTLENNRTKVRSKISSKR